jgi:pimeloyl-ACP methyl ester carboxylesterase
MGHTIQTTLSAKNSLQPAGRSAWLGDTRSVIALLAAGVLAVYFLLVRPQLAPASASQIELIALGILLLALVVGLLVFLVTVFVALIIALRDRERAQPWLRRMRGEMLYLLVFACMLVVIMLASQWTAYTPPILGQDGKSLPNSITSLEKVKLGGVDQWLIIRGQNVDNPVLLFLSGGPGSSEAGRVLRFNQELEKHFVVVILEQRGCAKSYPSLNPKSALTVDQYTADIIELTNMLRERFDENKIYLVGHSWGTLIGTRAVQARPELFHAYIGTAQMVDVLETDQIIYQMMLEHSRQTGDTQFVQTLEKQGGPPYFGKNPIWPYSTLFGREYEVFEAANIKNEEFRRDGDLMFLMLKQPEYGWLDRLYYILSLKDTFNVVYPQLQELDFRRDAAKLDLPVYLIQGRHDMNDPYQLPEEYFNLLEAPHKQLYFFEDSGHGMIWEEAGKFHDIMINTVLPETYQP